jgi:hypothetical protein
MPHSKGPFTADKCELPGYPDGEGHGAAVFASDGFPFCYVCADDCVGGDVMAAVARATRIAESLNKTEGHA